MAMAFDSIEVAAADSAWTRSGSTLGQANISCSYSPLDQEKMFSNISQEMTVIEDRKPILKHI